MSRKLKKKKSEQAERVTRQIHITEQNSCFGSDAQTSAAWRYRDTLAIRGDALHMHYLRVSIVVACLISEIYFVYGHSGVQQISHSKWDIMARRKKEEAGGRRGGRSV